MNEIDKSVDIGFLRILDVIKKVKTPKGGVEVLRTLMDFTPKIENALALATKSHKGQYRKSGEPYIVHPICVASIVAFCGGDEAMVCAALLHDVVEDTPCKIEYIVQEFGQDVANLVDALTKITEIRKEELGVNAQNPRMVVSALTFRKILISAIQDPRALVVKISDRLHNMLTLDALPNDKQVRISKETLAVYAPIASRLGMSSIKNELEDKSFYYIYPEEYKNIKDYLYKNKQSLLLKLNAFASKLEKKLLDSGFSHSDFKLVTRVKRPYSIHLKMQRKGAVNIDEILDLLAIRILLKNPIDCYKVLGIIHLNFKPIVSRFKDYIALPKENGYETIHTTIFDESSIYEVQIRTFDMHMGAEYGNSAHWKYKSGGIDNESMRWLQNFKYHDSDLKNNPKEFYELAKNDLYREDIVVFSPNGDTYTLPVGAIALDFAYMVHSDLGDRATNAYINNKKALLNQELRSGDVVKIIKGDKITPRFIWIDQLKTSKAKNHLRIQRKNRLKEIDVKSMINILTTFFERPVFEDLDLKDYKTFEERLLDFGVEMTLAEGMKSFEFLAKLTEEIESKVLSLQEDVLLEYQEVSLWTRGLRYLGFKTNILNFLTPSRQWQCKELENFTICTSNALEIKQVLLNDCCHPKYGDEIIAIVTDLKEPKAIVHHKFCKEAIVEVDARVPMIYIEWHKRDRTIYKMMFYLGERKAVLANLLAFLTKNECNIVGVSYLGYKDKYSSHCEVSFEVPTDKADWIRALISRKYQDRIVELSSLGDAYEL
ncbi:RelA/SpoT family protein [Helicobacter cetorum]|uniref:Penta-phosphate guanosine-3'-pyrophosphohydrolase SpoT n=1 Tax=Helicobacter cetorum (strain ATCC BAA-540 / CCUG 52418 / MIT 99-5656) TaxID=1163745 RepID=I0ETX7_HELCM|nr:RelA/SpoT family protein [Helicobacter cetorum]AFI06396.1 penta-phosphate guanosine-3'-pyrophosphohydrolase SpoT [Helicobacter cetorum MIT 99-5656]